MRDKEARQDSLLACGYKDGYTSYSVAEQVAKRMNARRKAGRSKEKGHAVARIYKCDCCGKYHITGTKFYKTK